MSYDRMGRRVAKNNQRFIYDGYLCIGKIEDSTSIHYSLSPIHCFVWDPTEPVATRPLAWLVLRSLGEGGYYTHDGNKNVSEVMASDGAIAAHYEYAPFGFVTVQRGESVMANPWRFSSEYAENETETVYYNYRHYESTMGRWIVRDCIGEFGGLLLCGFIRNSPLLHSDVLGNRITKSFAQYEFSPKHCELRVQLKWYLMFRNVEDHEQWTRSEKSEWKRKVKSAVEGYFNDIPFRCLRSGKCCQCKDGIKVKLKLKFVGYEESWLDAIFGFEYNVKVTVYKDPRYRSFVEGVSGDTFLNEDDGDNDGGGKQITAVHEVGHQLGLNHPGMWSGESENSSADYTSDYNGLPGKYNLMGEGMALHEDDFNRAFCDHINYDECDK
jgi:RHS repeat-associated protein